MRPASSNFLSRSAGLGCVLARDASGPPLEAQMYKPYGIDLAGNKLYVSDSYNNRLRVVNLP